MPIYTQRNRPMTAAERQEHYARLKQENERASLQERARLGDTSFLPNAVTLEQIRQQGETGRTQLQGQSQRDVAGMQGQTHRDVAGINIAGELERQRMWGTQMTGLEGLRGKNALEAQGLQNRGWLERERLQNENALKMQGIAGEQQMGLERLRQRAPQLFQTPVYEPIEGTWGAGTTEWQRTGTQHILTYGEGGQPSLTNLAAPQQQQPLPVSGTAAWFDALHEAQQRELLKNEGFRQFIRPYIEAREKNRR